MSTRARIAVLVKDDDLHRTFNPQTELLHAELNTSENPGKVCLNPTTIMSSYISIYHHWDGYVECLGQTLVSKYDSYDKALNLMLFGGASTINDDDSVTFYHSWRGEQAEPWEYNKPQQTNSLSDLVKSFENSDQEFLYVYAPDCEGKYRWFYTENGYGKEPVVFEDVESRLNGEEYFHPIPINYFLNGSDGPDKTKTAYALVCQVGESVEVISISTDKDKLISVMREKVIEQLEDRFGKESDLDPEVDDYELYLFKTARNLTGGYWSDDDDECPVQFYIHEADFI